MAPGPGNNTGMGMKGDLGGVAARTSGRVQRTARTVCVPAPICFMNKTSKEKEAVLNVFAALVRPLMRVAFEYGISAGEIAGVVRRGYIQALESRLQDQKRPTTDSRLAAVAGLPRADVSALR